MKSIIILSLCVVAIFAQTGRPSRRGGAPCRPDTTLGVTQTMCDSFRACVQALYPPPAAGTVRQTLTDAERAAQKAAKQQAEATCAAQVGISATALAAMRPQRPATGTTSG